MFQMLYCALFVLFLANLYSSHAKSYLQNNYPASVIEDANLDTMQLLRKYKYPVERHYVTTADSYTLCMHRIPNTDGVPVLLMHGLLDSSATWILMGPHSGLGYFLYDNGYDVWMGNARGNRYSRNHTTLNPDYDRNFWNFGFHEIAMVDLPTMIDYVLVKTSFERLFYVGHSQVWYHIKHKNTNGTGIFWILCSMLPAYNEKIIMMHALAPAAFFKHSNGAVKDALLTFIPTVKDVVNEFLSREFFTRFFSNFCFSSILTDQICLELFWLIMGRDAEQFNRTSWPAVLGHLPAGISLKQLVHFYQIIERKRFGQFDYGTLENQHYYGQATPPDYPLEKITTPVALYYTLNDALSNYVDVRNLVKILPNVVIDKLYRNKLWNHMTVLWGMNARKVVQVQILRELRKRQ